MSHSTTKRRRADDPAACGLRSSDLAAVAAGWSRQRGGEVDAAPPPDRAGSRRVRRRSSGKAQAADGGAWRCRSRAALICSKSIALQLLALADRSWWRRVRGAGPRGGRGRRGADMASARSVGWPGEWAASTRAAACSSSMASAIAAWRASPRPGRARTGRRPGRKSRACLVALDHHRAQGGAAPACRSPTPSTSARALRSRRSRMSAAPTGRPGPAQQSGETHDVGRQRAVGGCPRHGRARRDHGMMIKRPLALRRSAAPPPRRARLAMSSWYLSSTPSVSSTACASEFVLIEVGASAAAQSIVSATPGSLNRSIVAQPLHEGDHLGRQPLRQCPALWPPGWRARASRAGVIHPLIEAPPPDRIVHLAGAVAGEDDDRLARRATDGAELRHGDLVVGQQFEQERLERLVGAVQLVDQQHGGRLPGVDGAREQRALLQDRRGRRWRIAEPGAGRARPTASARRIAISCLAWSHS